MEKLAQQNQSVKSSRRRFELRVESHDTGNFFQRHCRASYQNSHAQVAQIGAPVGDRNGTDGYAAAVLKGSTRCVVLNLRFGFASIGLRCCDDT
jgi:hypothetical protein